MLKFAASVIDIHDEGTRCNKGCSYRFLISNRAMKLFFLTESYAVKVDD